MKAMLILYCSGLLSQSTTTKTQEHITVEDPILLQDIFISVKTTYKNHDSRLLTVLRTWYQLARGQTWFFTDRDDRMLEEYTDGHMVTTRCGDSHSTYDLCCKANAEFDYYFYRVAGKKWFCHFDDDIFVNVPRLVMVLQTYDHRQDWYLGKNSIPTPRNVRNKTFERIFGKTNYSGSVSFTFATGGAYCISNSLATKMAPYAREGRIESTCKSLSVPDDVAVGYIIEVLLKKNLTVVPEFRMQFEPLDQLDPKQFQNQVSFTYLPPSNYINITGVDKDNDPTRFLSLYEFLYKIKPKPSFLSVNTKPPFHGRKMLRIKYDPI